MDCSLPGLLWPWDSAGKNTGMGCHFFLQGILPTQGLNLGFLHCSQILYLLSYKESLVTMLYNVIYTILYSVQFSGSVRSDSLWSHESQHARPPCPSSTPRVHSNPCPSSRWCHLTISSSVIPFSSCPQSLPASGSFQWVNSSHEVTKVLEFQLQHQSFQWTPRIDLLYNVSNPKRLSQNLGAVRLSYHKIEEWGQLDIFWFRSGCFWKRGFRANLWDDGEIWEQIEIPIS